MALASALQPLPSEQDWDVAHQTISTSFEARSIRCLGQSHIGPPRQSHAWSSCTSAYQHVLKQTSHFSIPQEMATTGPDSGPGTGNGQSSTGAGSTAPHRPTEALQNTQSTSAAVPQDDQPLGPKKRRNHRSKKKKQNRRQSFRPDADEGGITEAPSSAAARPGLNRLGYSGGRNLSDTSLASEALLDHR